MNARYFVSYKVKKKNLKHTIIFVLGSSFYSISPEYFRQFIWFIFQDLAAKF